jgi:thymidine kinase
MGGIEVICGCMYSGKTEELIRRLRRAKIAKQSVGAFKHASDDRYDPVSLGSHGGVKLEARPYKTVAGLDKAVRGLEVIGIDEVQFFDEDIVPFIERLANIGCRVIVAGLDLDFAGTPFNNTMRLLALAERVTKLSAVCTFPECGADASRSHRLVADTTQVLVGGTGVYEARCRTHWTAHWEQE